MKIPAETQPLEAGYTVDLPPKASGKNTDKVRLLTLSHLDGRTTAARRVRELIEAFGRDLGGAGQLSEGARQLIQRAAVLGAYIEHCEAQWLGGVAIDLADYLQVINAQRRVLASIALERRSYDRSTDGAISMVMLPGDENL
jgi:hypothetical protein